MLIATGFMRGLRVMGLLGRRRAIRLGGQDKLAPGAAWGVTKSQRVRGGAEGSRVRGWRERPLLSSAAQRVGAGTEDRAPGNTHSSLPGNGPGFCCRMTG